MDKESELKTLRNSPDLAPNLADGDDENEPDLSTDHRRHADGTKFVAATGRNRRRPTNTRLNLPVALLALHVVLSSAAAVRASPTPIEQPSQSALVGIYADLSAVLNKLKEYIYAGASAAAAPPPPRLVDWDVGKRSNDNIVYPELVSNLKRIFKDFDDIKQLVDKDVGHQSIQAKPTSTAPMPNKKEGKGSSSLKEAIEYLASLSKNMDKGERKK